MTMNKTLANYVFVAKHEIEGLQEINALSDDKISIIMKKFPEIYLRQLFLDFISKDDSTTWRELVLLDYEEDFAESRACFSNREYIIHILTTILLISDSDKTQKTDCSYDAQISALFKHIPDSKSKATSIIDVIYFLIKNCVTWKYVANTLFKSRTADIDEQIVYQTIYEIFSYFSEFEEDNETKIKAYLANKTSANTRVKILYNIVVSLVDWKFIAKVKFSTI